MIEMRRKERKKRREKEKSKAKSKEKKSQKMRWNSNGKRKASRELGAFRSLFRTNFYIIRSRNQIIKGECEIVKRDHGI